MVFAKRFLLATMLAGCSSLPAPTAPTANAVPPASRIPQAGEPARSSGIHLPPGVLDVRHVFLSDAVANKVAIFTRGKARTIGGFQEPQGIATDGSGALYVADTINERVQVFDPPYRNKASATLATPGEWPVSVAVSKSGLVAAVIICQAQGTQCGAPGSFYFFANKQATSPCAVVSAAGKISRPLWSGFDANGTLYVTGINNYTTAKVGAVHGGCNAKSLVLLAPSVTISFGAGIQVDPKGNVAVLDSRGPSGAPSIDVFAPPKRHSSLLKLLTEGTLSDSGVVSSFALNKNGTALFTAEPHYSLAYHYPNGGRAIGQFVPPPSTGDLIEGVAVTPAEVP